MIVGISTIGAGGMLAVGLLLGYELAVQTHIDYVHQARFGCLSPMGEHLLTYTAAAGPGEHNALHVEDASRPAGTSESWRTLAVFDDFARALWSPSGARLAVTYAAAGRSVILLHDLRSPGKVWNPGEAFRRLRSLDSMAATEFEVLRWPSEGSLLLRAHGWDDGRQPFDTVFEYNLDLDRASEMKNEAAEQGVEADEAR
jgi:hypothetical protein